MLDKGGRKRGKEDSKEIKFKPLRLMIHKPQKNKKKVKEKQYLLTVNKT